MALPNTTYKVLNPIPARISMKQAGAAVHVITLPEDTTFRISLWNNVTEDDVEILLQNESIAAAKELKELLTTGRELPCISISKEKLEQNCLLTSDFSQAIYFYTVQDKYGAFSNFSPHGFESDGSYFATAEHYYQSEKFEDDTYKQRVMRVATAKDAADLGKTKNIGIRQDWEQVKIAVMRKALNLKFSTHEDIRNLLLSTGDLLLIENSPYDNYWGIGRTGTGQNHLGTLLMQIRQKFAGQQ